MAAERSEFETQRSRNSCDKCRRKKIKCDEAKPICSQCRARGSCCETTVVLKWETDYQDAGRAFGRAGVWSKHTSNTERTENTIWYVVIRYIGRQDDHKVVLRSTQLVIPTVPLVYTTTHRTTCSITCLTLLFTSPTP